MKNLIKNNIEIFIAIVFIIVIAAVILGGDAVGNLFKGGPLEFDEDKLIELIKDRPESQQEVFKQRIQSAKELLEEDPESAAAFEIIGFLHDTLGDKETAKKYYSEVLKLNPENTVVLNNLANVYSAEKKFKEAEELYLKITEVDPSNIEAWRDLHDLYYYLYEAKQDQADDILLLGLEKNPGEPQILAMLAVYYQDNGEPEQAIRYYKQLLEVAPDNKAAQRELKRLQGGL